MKADSNQHSEIGNEPVPVARDEKVYTSRRILGMRGKVRQGYSKPNLEETIRALTRGEHSAGRPWDNIKKEKAHRRNARSQQVSNGGFLTGETGPVSFLCKMVKHYQRAQYTVHSWKLWR